MGLGVLIIWFWLDSDSYVYWLAITIGGLLEWYGFSCIRIGLFGSQKLIDEMNLKGELSEEGRDEWNKLHKDDG